MSKALVLRGLPVTLLSKTLLAKYLLLLKSFLSKYSSAAERSANLNSFNLLCAIPFRRHANIFLGSRNTTFSNNTLIIKFRAPFEPRRGRINCSLNDNGKWRWFGIQFPIK